MSNTTNHVSGLLSRLNNALNKNQKKNSTDFKELSEARKKAFIKCKDGKNQFVFLIPDGQADPFVEWGYHNNLLEVDFYSIPCDLQNKHEDCIVCNIVKSLQAEDFQGNKHIWMPIQLKTEWYAPVIDVTDNTTIAAGPKWLKLSKTSMNQIFEWLKNLEADEVEFYNEEEPQRIIVNYDKTQLPKDQYKLDKKNAKAFSAQQLADWKGAIQPINSYLLSKSQDELKKIVDEYFAKIEQLVSTSKEEQTVTDEVKNISTDKAISKLDILKNKK